MLSHDRIWQAIDRLAEEHDLTASGLARKAGLDPTTFNRSKRVAADGRPRWPSTESIAKILTATATEMSVFLAIDVTPPAARFGGLRPIPLLGLTEAGAGRYFDDAGFPVGQGWEEVEFPGAGEIVFALEVSGESMLPLYRPGDRLIVTRDADVRRGDRVVVRTTGGEVMAKILERKTGRTLELASFNPAHPTRTLPLAEVDWMARIIWASQ